MRTKRVLVLLLVAVMMAAVFAGCNTKQQPTKPAEKPVEKIKIGLVTDVGGRGDMSFNDSALRGLEEWAAKEKYVGNGGYTPLTDEEYKATISDDLADRDIHPLNIEPVVLESKEKKDYTPNITTLVEQEHCKLVIGVGFMLADAIGTAAKKYPDTKFMLIDSTPTVNGKSATDLPNEVSYLFREQQGGFLAGAIAGYATKSNKIGYIGGMKIPPVLRYEAGFEAGVKTTNPNAKVISVYTGKFNEPALGVDTAESEINQGCDVLFHAAGATGNGMFQVICQKGAPYWGIGVDVDMGINPKLCPDRTLTCAIKHVDYATYLAIKSVVDGTFKPGIITMGIKDGGVGYAPDHIKDVLTPDQIKKINHLRQMIINGEIQIPEDPEKVSSWTPPSNF